MKTRIALACWLLAALAAPAAGQETAAGQQELPYVYTQWKHFTVKDGLPNDHIFAVKVDGPRIWVGTEDGLALIDKPSGKVVKVWKEEDRSAMLLSRHRASTARPVKQWPWVSGRHLPPPMHQHPVVWRSRNQLRILLRRRSKT